MYYMIDNNTEDVVLGHSDFDFEVENKKKERTYNETIEEVFNNCFFFFFLEPFRDLKSFRTF